ncbi:MAG: hypothetical protein V1822_01895, partial [Candidatus Micrarchaeota archaeon]
SAHKNKIDALCKGAYEAFNKKSYTDSIKMLKDALKQSPQDKDIKQALGVAYNGRGVANYNQGKFEHAIADFEMAVQAWPAQNQYKLNAHWTKEAARRAAKGKKKKK